jgi:hypothetical protein
VSGRTFIQFFHHIPSVAEMDVVPNDELHISAVGDGMIKFASTAIIA